LEKQRLENLVIDFDRAKKLFPGGLCALLLQHTYSKKVGMVEDSVGTSTCWFKLNSILLLSERGDPVVGDSEMVFACYDHLFFAL
jgi:hypothetical protein